MGVTDGNLDDWAHPEANWGRPQGGAEQKGQVSWWNEEKGMGMIMDVSSKKEYFVAIEEIKTDPFEDEPDIDPNDEKYYRDLAPNDKAREVRRTLLLSQRQELQRDALRVPDPKEPKPQHLYPGMRVWFDGKEEALGPVAVNVHWELCEVIPIV